MLEKTEIPIGLKSIVLQVGFACFLTSTSRSIRDLSFLCLWMSDSLVPVVSSNAALLATFVLLVVLSSYFGKTDVHLLVSLAGAVAVCAGYGGILACTEGFSDISIIMGWAFGIAFGVGGAIGFSSWLIFLELDGNQATYTVIASSLLAGLAGLVLTHPDIQPYAVPLCMLLTVFSFVCLVILYREKLQLNLGSYDSFDIVATVKGIWRPALCVGTLGMISIVSRYMLDDWESNVSVMIATLGEIIPCLVLILLLAWPSFNADITSVYKLLFPIVALLFLMLSFFGGGYVPALAVISGSAYQLCMMLMIPQALAYARQVNAPAFAVYGVCSTIIYLLVCLGYPVIPLGKVYFGYALYPVAAVLMLYVLSVGLIAGTNASKRSIDRMNRAEQRASDDTLVFALPDKDGKTQLGAQLSAREEEVLRLILAGRDVPHIAEALVLSKNTVRTHVRNLYGKFGVHSRQELIDLLDVSTSRACPDEFDSSR